MKTVNLLPSWYLQQGRQNRHLRVHLIIMLVLGGFMVAAAFADQHRVSVLRHQRAFLESRLVLVGDPADQLATCQTDLRRLDDLRLAFRELGKTVPMSSVIQQVQNDMTPGMTLARIAIDVRPDPVKGSGFVGDTRNPPKYHDVAYLVVEGIAPNDLQIAKLIEKLSANPLFADVTLDFTKTGTLKDWMVRRFSIQLKLDLERLTTEDPAGLAGQVASGGPVDGR